MEKKITELESRIIGLEARLNQVEQTLTDVVNQVNKLVNNMGTDPYKTQAFVYTKQGTLNLSEKKER